MSDRLAELRRQRALVQDHLAWLDREIAATPAATTAALAPNPLPSAEAAPESVPLADSILDQYRMPAATLKQDVRKGCLLYFAGAVLLLALGVTILFFVLRRP